MVIGDESKSLEEVKSTLNSLETSLDSCPTLVPLSRQYPHLASRSDNGPMNYANKVTVAIF